MVQRVLKGALWVSVILLVLGRVGLVSAQTFVVNTPQDVVDASYDCSDTAALCSLRAAIQQANALTDEVTTIRLAADTYRITTAGNLEDEAQEGDFDIKQDVIILGVGREQTIIDGGQLDRVFDIRDAANVEMHDVTIQKGSLNAISGFKNKQGGGILVNSGSSLSLFNCTIANNETNVAGGGIFGNGSNLIVDNCIIEGNVSQIGGGIEISGGTATVTGVTFKNNYADFGGGFVNKGSTTTISHSTFYENSALSGSAIDININPNESVLYLKNSTISGNTSQVQGSITGWTDTTMYISNSAIVNNSGEQGGHIFNFGSTFISNSIIAGNTNASNVEQNCGRNSGQINSLGFNILGSDFDCNFSAVASDQVGTQAAPVNPMLGALVENGGSTLTHALLTGSPAIDSGNPVAMGSGGAACESLDQRGINRADGGKCDIGPYELIGSADLTVVINETTTSQNDTDILSRVVQVGNNGPNNANNLTLKVILPIGAENQNTVGEGWECAAISNTITCERSSFAMAEQSAVEVNFWPPNGVATLQMAASIAATTNDPQASNNQFSLTIELELPEESSTDEALAGSDLIDSSELTESGSQGSVEAFNRESVLSEGVSSPGSSAYDGNWPTDWNTVGHVQEENTYKERELENLMTQMKDYEDSWASRVGVNLSESALNSGLFTAVTGSIFIAGMIGLYLQSATLFGLLFSLPLYAPIDPIVVVMIKKDKRKRREQEMQRQREIENRTKLGNMLDESEVNDR